MKRIAMLAVVAILVVVAVPADGSDRGFYIGVGTGPSSFDVADFNDEFSNLYFETDNFGVKVFGGYQFLKHLAVQVGYTDFGQITRRETNIYYEDQSLKVSINDWDASAIGIVPLGKRASFYGKLGVAAWNADVTVDDGHTAVKESSSGTDVIFGLGFDFRFKKFGLRISGDHLTMSGTSGANLFAGSLTYRF